MTHAPRRLIDLPGVDDLELKALMKPRYADPDARDEFPEIDALTQALFGLTGEAAEAVALPDTTGTTSTAWKAPIWPRPSRPWAGT